MRTTPDALPSGLHRGLRDAYLVTGSEPLLIGEACDAIRASARRQQIAEREVHFLERGFDWNALLADAANLSLFASRRLIELRLGPTPDAEAGRHQRMAGAGDAEQLRYGGGRRKLGWFLGSLGSIAARQGHREEALLYSARLEEWDRLLRDAGDVNGEAAYFRAVIATQLGDREEAIRLLQLAIPLNLTTLHVRHRWMHIDHGLAPLRGYPPFEALLKPKD